MALLYTTGAFVSPSRVTSPLFAVSTGRAGLCPSTTAPRAPRRRTSRRPVTARAPPPPRAPAPAYLALLAAFAAGVAATLLATNLASASTRYATADDIPAGLIRAHADLRGSVIRVTDGDTFRLRHQPRLQAPGGGASAAARGNLTDTTIVVRIAAVDAPETAKFGKEGQRFGEEAKEWVKEQLLGKEVRVRMLSRDRYGRVVGEVWYGMWPGQKNLSAELLKRGLATVYRQAGAEYGDLKDVYDKVEAQAKANKVGMWGVENLETPAEYKKRMRDGHE